MISVITCSCKPPSWNDHEHNVEKTAGCAHEYIRIDNTGGRYGMCAAYNEGVSRARGEILVFVHEDVFFMEPGWGRILQTKFAGDPTIGLVGVAGTQYLGNQCYYWVGPGMPFLRGRIIQQLDNATRNLLSVFSFDRHDSEVVAADGLFFAIPAALFDKVTFDQETFPGFHFYDLDICMQVRRHARCIVTWDILVKHLSAGTIDTAFHEAGTAFLRKHAAELPAQCAPGTPDSFTGNGVKHYVLQGQMPPTIK